jgi:cardiolipin synthase A/B
MMYWGQLSLEILSTIIVILLLIVVWLFIDFFMGRKRHLHNLEHKTYPIRESNIQLFSSGPELFSDLFTEIKKAKAHIHIQFYIVKDDDFSIEFLTLIKEKAREGIEVRLLLDWMGSLKGKKTIIRQLENTDVDYAFCHVPKPPFLFYTLQVRNHRKITVIDGKIGYVGGFNIGKEYINLDPILKPWRDYHLRIQGEGVQDLQQVFFTDWEKSVNQPMQKKSTYFPLLKKGAYRHRFFPTEGFHLEDTFSTLIRSADHSIVIGTPYFIPRKKVFHELIAAVQRGVKLEILVPSKADHPLVKEASYPYLRRLIPLGATIYQYEKGFYHAKALLIDDKICDIGTANFDKRSFYLNYEINCFMYDHHLIEQVRGLLEKDQKNARILILKDLNHINPWTYCKEVLARTFSLFL